MSWSSATRVRRIVRLARERSACERPTRGAVALFSILAAALVASSASVASFPSLASSASVTASSPAQAPAQAKPPPWPVLLGLRVADLEHKIPVMDRVVLVPDEATYLDEISRWTTTAQWPVLIEDERLTPLFVRGFKPAQVFRRTDRAAPLPADGNSRRRALEAAVAKVWSGGEPRASPAAAFAAAGLVPLGLVITSTEDPAWPAAVALAAGRGQLLGFLDGNWGTAADTLNAARFEQLSSAVTELFRSAQFQYRGLGDQLDACTICRSIAAKCTPDLPLNQRFAAVGAPETDPKDPLAVTDVLCRNGNGSRYALCGAIWGDAPRSAYAAMCSLFLPRTSVTFISAYGEMGNFAEFGIASIQERLEPAGYRLKPRIGSDATLRAWQLAAMGGFEDDVLFVNSSGDTDTFHLGIPGQTPPENQGTGLDIPLLAKPMALQMVHSFSLHSLGNPWTIGARWLDHGVYSYVGSVQEPFLPAFIPPRGVMERLASFVPFLVAARHWDGPLSVPWRIATFGDPLMLVPPPVQPVRVRLPATTAEPSSASGNGRSLEALRDSATEMLRACQTDPTPESFRRAFRELDKLGDDTIPVKLWAIASQRGVRDGAARAALGALFRARDVDAFLDAFRAVSDPDGEARDMLWGLMTPRFQSLDSVAVVDLLANNSRAFRTDLDLIRLAPAVARLRSREAARSMLLEASARATNAIAQQALREAATEY